MFNLGAKKFTFVFLFSFGLIACGPSKKEDHSAHEKSQMESIPSGSHGTTNKNSNEAGDPQEDVLASYLGESAPHPGASLRGRVFDFGPRQFPLNSRPKTIALESPITSCNQNATDSINSGFAHLHAFQILEAERYFRFALHQDPKCSMALWGAGLSQIIFGVGDLERGYKFAKLSVDLSQHLKIKLTDLEKSLQNILLTFLKNPNSDESKKTFVGEWIKITDSYPQELELKSLGALFLWQYELIEKLAYTPEKIDLIYKEIFSQKPLHPAHHARIHLWNDGKNETKALNSAELIGPAFLNSAHMWHMGSHIYSQLGMFFESNEQYIRAAFVDQNQQHQALEFPYMIHNYGHNQHYWSYNLMGLGLYKKAAELAKGLLEIPLHPKHNNPNGQLVGNSAIYHSNYIAGIDSLLGNARHYGNHQLLVDAEKKGYFPADARSIGDKKLMLKLFFQLGLSYTWMGEDIERFKYRVLLHDLSSQNPDLLPLSTVYIKILDLIKRWSEGEQNSQIVDELKETNSAQENVLSNLVLAQLYRSVNKPESVISTLGDLSKNPYADIADYLELAYAQALLKQQDAALATFEKCQLMGAFLDKDSDYYRLGEKILIELKLPMTPDWRKPHEPRDLSLKIPTDFLGERFVHPKAPDFSLKNAAGKKLNLDDLLLKSEKGILLVFVLGGSCARCNEQLQQLNLEKDRLKKLGYNIVAITSDDENDLANTAQYANDETRIHYDLLSNSHLSVFKEYRAFDDFEGTALHGTFLIDKNKSIRFLDRGALPYTEFEHLILEIKRMEQLRQASRL